MTTPRLPIYLDYNSTTPVDPRVLEAMLPWFSTAFGNAASRTHVFGRQAREAVEKARSLVADLIGAQPDEVIFTSGATESINMALFGAARALRDKGNHVITCAVEHKAVLDTCKALEAEGFDITYLPVSGEGLLDPEQVRDALTSQTILISLMHANNEIGTIHPVAQIGKIAEEHGIVFHVDAAQSFGKEPINVRADGIHLMSISGHKIYAPKGIGALYARTRSPRIRLRPLLHGGGHERGLRPGTINVPGVVALGTAAEIAGLEMESENTQVAALRNRLNEKLHRELNDIFVNGSMERRLANNLNISFAHVEGESLIMSMRDVALSSGSACTSASVTPSHVLSALGVSPELIHSSIRFGLGRFTTGEEIDYAAELVVETVKKLRAMSPDKVIR